MNKRCARYYTLSSFIPNLPSYYGSYLGCDTHKYTQPSLTESYDAHGSIIIVCLLAEILYVLIFFQSQLATSCVYFLHYKRL